MSQENESQVDKVFSLERTAQLQTEVKLPLDRIARSAYETRKNELWNKIKDCFRGKEAFERNSDGLEYMNVSDLNARLSNLRSYAQEYNEIVDRLGSREAKVSV